MVALGDLIGAYGGLSTQREENMSRIHEALLKAERERNPGQAENAMTLSVEVAPFRRVAENSAAADAPEALTRTGIVIPPPSSANLRFDAPEALTRTGIVIPPPSSANLRFDALVAHCRHSDWHPKRAANVFLNSAVGALGAEQFRTLRSRLFQIRGNQPTYTLLVTSSLPDEGKTFVTNNLAQAILRQPHHRTLLIDADLRYPQLHLALGACLTPGLTDYLRGEADEITVLQKGDEDNLCFIPSGSRMPNPSELLSNGRLQVLLDRLTPIFDWVILDSSPCLPVADATVLAGLCDGVLLVVRADSTPVEAAQKVCQQLQGKNIVGVVLNGAEQNELYGSHYHDHRLSTVA
jgi:protein-tyrosine kinase